MPPLTPQVLWRSDEEQRRASTTGMAKYDKLRALTSSVVAGLKPRVFFLLSGTCAFFRESSTGDRHLLFLRL